MDTILRLQIAVFLMVAAAFTTIYITQPVLPVIGEEFGVDEAGASRTVSIVIFGIALSNLFFGRLADRLSIKPIVLAGVIAISLCGFFLYFVASYHWVIICRFIQGLFIPALTTCLAAYLSRTLPVERLNVVMGSYVSATVCGGMAGRLMGGWIETVSDWRYAFFVSSLLVVFAGFLSLINIPRDKRSILPEMDRIGYLRLLSRKEIVRVYAVVFSAFFVFSSLFNYIPFYLSGPAFKASTKQITMVYLSYIVGVFIAPISGKLSNRFGNGKTLAFSSAFFAFSFLISLIPSYTAVMISLCGVCAGFFSIHSAAAGAMNKKLEGARGRANALYVFFYYLGAFTGITVNGYIYMYFGWKGVVFFGILVLAVPFFSGISEMKTNQRGLQAGNERF